jgi:ribosomal protein S18 acetylase RimI-like enzyme
MSRIGRVEKALAISVRVSENGGRRIRGDCRARCAVPGADGSVVTGLVTTQGSGLVVRPYQSADRESLIALWANVFPDDPPWNAPASMIDAKLAVQPELLLVGECESRIVGAIMGGYDGVRGWLHHLAVAPESRRRGFASQLVHAAETGLRKLGCSKINLQVRESNREVVAFYRALGYEVEARVSMGRRFASR